MQSAGIAVRNRCVQPLRKATWHTWKAILDLVGPLKLGLADQNVLHVRQYT